MPINIPAKADQSYRPSNGTEGMKFEEKFCNNCKKGEDCNIMFNAMWYEKTHEEYPPEWVFDADGNPTCTAFEKDDNAT